MKPCTMRAPEIGKKILESCDVQNFDNQVNAVVGAHMKRYRNKRQTTAGPSQPRIESIITHFQIPPYEFH
jgi:hypothetical protein